MTDRFVPLLQKEEKHHFPSPEKLIKAQYLYVRAIQQLKPLFASSMRSTRNHTWRNLNRPFEISVMFWNLTSIGQRVASIAGFINALCMQLARIKIPPTFMTDAMLDELQLHRLTYAELLRDGNMSVTVSFYPSVHMIHQNLGQKSFTSHPQSSYMSC
ncbi:uncharacterized protein [Lolium perenne]|uniref:uncharacterized protein n=1 Tax=Lolium perenne TaxID=4522 RepID=UPI0021F51D56|nr:uncharacterized protein LOC127317679 [Lolium perenne]